MQIDTQSGRLSEVRFVRSPNYDARPKGVAADLLVIHGISLPPGRYGGEAIEQFFTNTLDPSAHPYFEEIHDLKVSAHVLIRRDAEVVQFVPFHQRAWHAGESKYQGREECNDFSVGIELEGTDDEAYTDGQIKTLATVICALCHAYPDLSVDRIVGHCDIAPGRKTDPGEHFDWPRLRALLG